MSASKFLRAFKRDGSPEQEEFKEEPFWGKSPTTQQSFSPKKDDTIIVPLNLFIHSSGKVTVNEGTGDSKIEGLEGFHENFEGDVWRHVGEWDNSSDETLSFSKSSHINVVKQLTDGNPVTVANPSPPLVPLRPSRCPFGHGSVGIGPYPNYVHGRNTAICPNNCKPIPTLGAHGDISETWQDTLMREAIEFQLLFTKENDVPEDQARARLNQVKRDIIDKGNYEHTLDELNFGTRVAWRNAPKCANRKHWDCLEVMDARHVTDEEGMIASCLSLLERAAETCALTANILMFRNQTPGTQDGPRIWNNQLLRFACYREGATETLIGDPSELGFSQMVEVEHGWTPPNPRSRFDLLPLMVQAHPDRAPIVRTLPPQYSSLVLLTHPRFEWFESLGLKWYAIPIVSNIHCTIGGLTYTACPFNGWYSVTEIVRNLTDESRYDISRSIATKMCINTHLESTLWRDLAMAEIGVAILYSFGKAGFGITDHHSMLESFYHWYYNELETRGYCPGNWKWIIPPMGPSLNKCYLGLSKMTEYTLKPAYIAGPGWMKFRRQWLDSDVSEGHYSREILAKRKEPVLKFYYITKFCRMMLAKKNSRLKTVPTVLIIYVTVSGTARQLAQKTFQRLHCHLQKVHIIDAATQTLDDLIDKIVASEHIIIIASTYGSGDVPKSGINLLKLLKSEKSVHDDLFHGKTYSLLALGSTAYPRFCAAGEHFEEALKAINAQPLFEPYVKIDELTKPEDTFEKWYMSLLANFEERRVLTFDAVEELGGHVADDGKAHKTFVPPEPMFTVTKIIGEKKCKHINGTAAIVTGVRHMTDAVGSTVHLEVIIPKVRARTLLVSAGDEVMVAAQNCSEDVNRIAAAIGLLGDALDGVITLDPLSSDSSHEFPFETPQTYRNILTHHLAINEVLSYDNIRTLAYFSPNDQKLAKAAESFENYEKLIWSKNIKWMDMFHYFPSLYGKVSPTHLVTMIPQIKLRYYSLANSPTVIPYSEEAMSKIMFDMGEIEDEGFSVDSLQHTRYVPKAGDLVMDLVVALHKFKNHAGDLELGFCSNWLNTRSINDVIYLNTVRMQSFRLPYDIRTPVILIGTGAGIAPLRSFWQERAIRLKEERTSGVSNTPGEFILVFGCRNDHEASQLFKEELRECDDTFSCIEIAYSRMAEHPKRYVQDVMRQSDRIRRVLENSDSQIMICGSVNMATGVEASIGDVIGAAGLSKLKAENRLKLDVFGASAKMK
jgi:nitric oxide synthase oxygenase domain/subunit/sulfite reductase alpha subunit-like flavoprotein